MAEEKDIGFGKKQLEHSVRLINPDGSINVKRKGLPWFRPFDLYHALMTMSWFRFMSLVTLSFFLTNLGFAGGYHYLEGKALSMSAGAAPQRFWDSFFFSVQTITTVGYGAISPVSNGAKILSSIESFIGLLSFALATGLLYGRFSRPLANIQYSKNVVVAPFNEGKALMYKMINKRSSKLIEAEVKMMVSLIKDGKRIYQNLDLQLSKINFFALSWTVVHPISEDSPLSHLTKENVAASDAEVIILVKAFDDTFSQTVYSRMSYKAEDFVWDAKFKSSISEQDGQMTVNLDELNDLEPLT